ncbi:MAG: DUF4212 domain-containing protein [Candidatus Methanomethylicaceae archaeon]
MPTTEERAHTLKISHNNISEGNTIEEPHSSRYMTSQIYWNRLKKITAIWMLAWIFPAIMLHIPVGLTSSIKVLNGIPLHWLNAALLSILIGVILIFLYAFAMDNIDRILKEAQA